MKTFYPRKSIFIPASSPHPDNTEYKISVGSEDWSGSFNDVIKVQMVYNGIISGRRSPSYPSGSDDSVRVKQAIEVLEAKCRIRLLKNITFTKNNDLLESLENFLMKSSEFLTGYVRETTSTGLYFLILNFKSNTINETDARDIIGKFILLLKEHNLDAETDFIDKYF